jgi:hypothetical protein
VMGLDRVKLRVFALAAVVAIAAGLTALIWEEPRTVAERPVSDFPALFGTPQRCPSAPQAIPRATQAEEHAYFYAERYPYDPRDGIAAVHRFQEAQSCYRAAGLADRAQMAGRRASELIARINVDYASSRLMLENALDSEQWALALSEIHRLLRLTEHVGDHAYVTHLWSIVGKVSIRANARR